jgi:hypothetical protein
VPVASQGRERLCIFIEVPVASQETERSCNCLLGLSS